MSRIFKRPMFRKGGPTNEGIMTGIVDREMHAVSDPGGVGNQSAKERILRAYEEQNVPTVDPLTQFLLDYGRTLSETRPSGGNFATLLKATGKPIESLTQNIGAREKEKRKLGLEGELIDIEQTGKKALQDEKIQAEKDLLRMQLDSKGLKTAADYEEMYQGSSVQAANRAKYENEKLETKANEQFGESYKGFIGGAAGDLKNAQRNNNLGNIYYDVTDARFKRLRKKKTGEWDWETLDIYGYDKEADKKINQPQLSEFAKKTNKAIEERRKIKEAEEKQKRLDFLREQPFYSDPFGGA